MDDPYKLLGVARDASQDDIRKAFRKLAKKHHPDLNPGNSKAEELFKNISSAHELLSDPEKRGQFDRGEIDAVGHERQPSYRDHADGEPGRRYSRESAEANGWSDDAFKDLFSSMFNGAHQPIPAAGRDERFSLTAEFLDAVNGVTKRLTLPGGRVLDVKIPPGTAEGQVLRLQGLAGPGINGGPAGDALIEIHIAPHPVFTRDGQDIRLDLSVSLSEAVLGGQIQVPTPTGPVRMTIAADSDSGTVLRLRGRGVPAHGTAPAGQLYVKLSVVIGTADAALKDFVSSWKPEHSINLKQAMAK